MFYTAAYAAMQRRGAFAVVSHFANVGENTLRSKIMRAGQAVPDAGRHFTFF
jgi:peptide subunit release factor RF-3